MIDFNNYKRLTERDEYGNADIIGLSTEKLFGELYFDEINLLTKALNKLAFLEDKIENGTLVKLLCKGIEELDIIKKGMIFIFYKMCLEQNLGQGVFLKYKSKINEWFKNYLKNKELQEEQECR